ncbi:MAG: heavy metal-associated domain-containing protein [Candidatus Micrarchaeota archaeon]
MQKELAVSGMHCSSCELLLKDAVGGVPGVKTISVDAKAGRVRVDVDSAGVLEAVKAAIRSEGYGV